MASSEVKAHLKVVGEAQFRASIRNARSDLASIGPAAKSSGGSVMSALGSGAGGATSVISALGGAAVSAGGLIVSGLVKSIEMLVTVGAAGVTALFALGIAASKAAADFESAKFGLESVLGSTKAVELEWLRLEEIAKLPGIGLEQAAKGITKLMSTGMSLDKAERSIKAFGNALASVGGGKERLNLVMLALSQISSTEYLQGDELNQLREHLPMASKIIKDAFGTVRTEDLKNLGVTSEQVIDTLITGLEKIPVKTGGATNAFDNLTDAIKIGLVSAGDVINTTFAPAFKGITDFISFLTKSNVFSGFAERMMIVGESFIDALGGKESLMKGVFSIVALLEKIPDMISFVGHGIIALGQKIYDIFSLPIKALDALASGIEKLTGTKIPRLKEMLLMPFNAILPGISFLGPAAEDFGKGIGSRASELSKMFGDFQSGKGKKRIPTLPEVQAATQTPILSSTMPVQSQVEAAIMKREKLDGSGNGKRGSEDFKRFVIGGGERAERALGGYQLGSGGMNNTIRVQVTGGGDEAFNTWLAKMFQRYEMQKRRVETHQ